MADQNLEAEASVSFPEYTYHEVTKLFPSLDTKSYDKLKEDIQATGGLLQPIIVYNNEIIDGRARYEACKELGIEPTVENLPDPEEGNAIDLWSYVISANLQRRHLTTSQRAIIAGRISTGRLGDNQYTDGVTIEKAAELLNIGKASVERGRKVLDDCPPEVIAAVEAGRIKVSAAEKLSKKYDADEQKGLVAGKASVLKAALKPADDEVNWSDRCGSLSNQLVIAVAKLNVETRMATVTTIKKRLDGIGKPKSVKATG